MICLKCLLQIEDPISAHYGLHPECFISTFNTSNLANFISLQRRSGASSDKPANHAPQNTSFFHGKFKKYSAELDGTSYILKMRQDDALELPVNSAPNPRINSEYSTH